MIISFGYFLLISIFKLNNLSLSKKYIYQYINYVNKKLLDLNSRLTAVNSLKDELSGIYRKNH